MPIYKDLSDQEKKIARQGVLAGLALLNLLLLALAASYGFAAWHEARGLLGTDKKLEVTVSGEGKVSAKPDVAKVTAAVLTLGPSLGAAQAENSRRMNAVMNFLREEEIAGEDIKTIGYSISPQYRYPRPCLGAVCPAEDPPRIIGYEVRSSLEITLRDLADAGAIFSGLVDAGANEVGGIVFTIDQPDELTAEARRQAIADAQEKAGKLAEDLGKRLGNMSGFTEGGLAPPVIFAREAALGGKGGGGPAPDIQPGENEIVVQVSITYELR